MSRHTIRSSQNNNKLRPFKYDHNVVKRSVYNDRFISEINQIVNFKNEFLEKSTLNQSLEEKLQQQQLRFEAIFENSIFGNAIVKEDFKIKEVNEAFTQLLGFGQHQLIGKNFLDLAHQDYFEDWKLLQEFLVQQNDNSFNIETMMVKNDHSLIWIELAVIKFKEGDTNFYYIILNDITDKIPAQSLEQNQEDKDIERSVLAHDLRSPIGTIKALSTLIKLNIEEGEHEEALFHLSLLEKTNDTSLDILNDLMLIGELENSKVEKQKVDVISAVKSVTDRLRIGAKMKDVTIKQEFLQNPVFVKASLSKMERVFQNILSNAIKFSKPGSEVKVFVKQQIFSVLIKIIDNGIGIPFELQTEVFNKFTSAKRRGTAGESTNGLGLFISKRIIDIHKGQIWFESHQDKGTTFYIRLPLMDDQEGV